ncbi:hypothetical protein [Bradyrhizobium archetypum]|uniref:Uncharacterized protein n=1 Tax=Bradyrhizobium archetypum TaxID=2721160 RepID=A0A7Y4M0V0_9BRAD|nr:hypothetical protein [Bradyrhizobium archetypum]NOJ46033.1 hypothetical protein [Bradyrhizobium archetypum]
MPGWWRRWCRCLTPEPATSPTKQRKNNDNGRNNTGYDPIVHFPLPPYLLAASTVTHHAGDRSFRVRTASRHHRELVVAPANLLEASVVTNAGRLAILCRVVALPVGVVLLGIDRGEGPAVLALPRLVLIGHPLERT